MNDNAGESSRMYENVGWLNGFHDRLLDCMKVWVNAVEECKGMYISVRESMWVLVYGYYYYYYHHINENISDS